MKTNAAPVNADATLRKAAILVSALDTRSADALLDRMDPLRAERVRTAVMQLDRVTREEEQRVLDEFMRAGVRPLRHDDSGIELDDSLAQQLASPAPPDHTTQPAAAAQEPEPPPFRFLHETTADQLAKHLRSEHPQVIAVVVAHLPPKRAADLIQRLAPTLQVDVLRRIAQLDTADPEILQEVEQQLELLLSDELRTARNRSAGLTAVTTILNAAGSQRTELLDNVTQHDRSLADQLGAAARDRSSMLRTPIVADPPREPAASPQPPAPSSGAPATRPVVAPGPAASVAGGPPPEPPAIAFATLARLDDRSLAKLIQETDPQVAMLALVGADSGFLQRILKQLPTREARSLRRKLQTTGPLRLADIERAQRHVARRAAELAMTGQLQLPEPKRFAVAA